MKLSINPKEISAFLKKASRVISNKNIIAILDNYLFEVKDGCLYVTAYDNEVWLKQRLPMLSSDGNFGFCVNAAKFTQAIDSVNSDNLEIELDEKNVMCCKHKKGRFNISYNKAEDYPIVNDCKSIGVMIDASCIHNIISNVAYAAGNDQLHVVMMGVYFDFTEAGLVGVATDAKRLVKDYNNQTQFNPDNNKSFIMPTKAANIIKTLIGEKSDDVVEIKSSEQSASLTLDGSWKVVFKLIAGKYPNYNRVIPDDSKNVAIVNKYELLDSIQRSVIFSQTSTYLVKLNFGFNEISIECQDLDYSLSAMETIPCEHIGEDICLGLDGSMLMSTLNNIQSDMVEFHLHDKNRPVVIKSTDKDDRCLSLVMPIFV